MILQLTTVTLLAATSGWVENPARAGVDTPPPFHAVMEESAISARTPSASPAKITPAPSRCIAGSIVELDPAGEPLRFGTQTCPQKLKLCDHEVALTFDDGPSPWTTPLVLRALRDAGIQATFLIGRNSRAYPALARQELREEHTVGHHSDTNPSFMTLRSTCEGCIPSWFNHAAVNDGNDASRAVAAGSCCDSADPGGSGRCLTC